MSNTWRLTDDLITESQQHNLANRGYKITSKINEGTFANVYLGEYITKSADGTQITTTQLAIKVIDSKRKANSLNHKILESELNVLPRIEHPHIIHIHSILQIGQKFFIFMRLGELGDLLDFILKNGRITENVARLWTKQISTAVQYLHELNIAHRDLKCENILLTKNYNVKLTDFGFSRFTVDQNRKSILSETYCGTYLYAPPEILQGQPYNPKQADLWSLGVIIFVMLNARMPFTDVNAKLLFENQWKRNYKFRSSIVDVLANQVKSLIANLLEPDPEMRIQIDDVVTSDWIAMDKRLQKLSSMEFAALSNAIAQRSTPPAIITKPILKIKKIQRFNEETPQEYVNLYEFKPFPNSGQRDKSQNLVKTIIEEPRIVP